MGYGMKYTKGGFPFHTKNHTKDRDDQSKEAAKKRGELCPKCGNRKGDCICVATGRTGFTSTVKYFDFIFLFFYFF